MAQSHGWIPFYALDFLFKLTQCVENKAIPWESGSNGRRCSHVQQRKFIAEGVRKSSVTNDTLNKIKNNQTIFKYIKERWRETKHIPQPTIWRSQEGCADPWRWHGLGCVARQRYATLTYPVPQATQCWRWFGSVVSCPKLRLDKVCSENAGKVKFVASSDLEDSLAPSPVKMT